MTKLSWFVLLSMGIAAVPGPTNLLVIAQAVAGERRRVLLVLTGVALANLLWVLLCSTGLSALLLASQAAFEALRVIGAVYLTYLGIRLLVSPLAPVNTQTVNKLREKGLLAQGFLTSATNPKAILFYSALLPQFASTAESVGVSAFAWGSLYVFIALMVFYVYPLLARSLSALLGRNNSLIQRAAGLGLLGSSMALLRWRASQ